MTAWLASLVCVVAVGDDAAKSELAALVKKVVDAPSYAATLESHRTQVPPTDEPEKNAEPWSFEFQRGQPLHCTRVSTELWRGEKKTAYQESKGKQRWIGIDRAQAVADAKDEKSGEKVRGIRRWIVELEHVVLPHEFLVDVAKIVPDLKREEKDGKVVYSGACTDEFTRQLSARSLRKQRDAKEDAKDDAKDEKKDEKKDAKEGERRGPTSSSTLHVVATKDAIESYEVELVVKGGVERHVLDRWTIAKLGGVTVEVPADVTTALNSRAP